MFRPVDDETIAQIVSRVEEEKMRLSQLSASSVALTAGDDDNDRQSLTDGGLRRDTQPMMVDEPVAVTSDPVQCTGLLLLLLSLVLSFLAKHIACSMIGCWHDNVL